MLPSFIYAVFTVRDNGSSAAQSSWTVTRTSLGRRSEVTEIVRGQSGLRVNSEGAHKVLKDPLLRFSLCLTF